MEFNTVLETAMRLLFVQNWKSNDKAPVEDWIKKLIEFAEMRKLTILVR